MVWKISRFWPRVSFFLFAIPGPNQTDWSVCLFFSVSFSVWVYVSVCVCTFGPYLRKWLWLWARWSELEVILSIICLIHKINRPISQREKERASERQRTKKNWYEHHWKLSQARAMSDLTSERKYAQSVIVQVQCRKSYLYSLKLRIPYFFCHIHYWLRSVWVFVCVYWYMLGISTILHIFHFAHRQNKWYERTYALQNGYLLPRALPRWATKKFNVYKNRNFLFACGTLHILFTELFVSRGWGAKKKIAHGKVSFRRKHS